MDLPANVQLEKKEVVRGEGEKAPGWLPVGCSSRGRGGERCTISIPSNPRGWI